MHTESTARDRHLMPKEGTDREHSIFILHSELARMSNMDICRCLNDKLQFLGAPIVRGTIDPKTYFVRLRRYYTKVEWEETAMSAGSGRQWNFVEGS